MESNPKKDFSGKEFLKTKIKSTVTELPVKPHVSSGTLEEHNFVGHSRNSRKIHYFQGSRD
jgi:hypothetical protein